MIMDNGVSRRTVLKSLLAGIPALALDWDGFPRGKANAGRGADGPYDAVIIGAGLGGLSCAAAFAASSLTSRSIRRAWVSAAGITI